MKRHVIGRPTHREVCSNLVYQRGLIEVGMRRTVADHAVVEAQGSNKRGAPCVTLRARGRAGQRTAAGYLNDSGTNTTASRCQRGPRIRGAKDNSVTNSAGAPLIASDGAQDAVVMPDVAAVPGREAVGHGAQHGTASVEDTMAGG
jgi:hypothetical protein